MHRHVEVYLDESGDLGLSMGSSAHFIVAALVVRKGAPLAMATNRCRRRFRSVLKGNHELKFNRCSPSIRRFVLEAVSSSDSMTAWSGFRKSPLPSTMRKGKDVIWGQVAGRTVSEVSRRLCVRSMDIVIDRRSAKKADRKAMDASLRLAVALSHPGPFPPEVRVRHVDSTSSPGLQLADHVAGAVFQSLERGDPSYIEIIKDCTVYGKLRS